MNNEFTHIHTPDKYCVQKVLIIGAIGVNILLCGALLGARSVIKRIKNNGRVQ